MIKMLAELNPIVVDVVVSVLFLSLFAIGIFKGFKHAVLNFILLLGSIALSFSSLLNIVKDYLVDFLIDKISLGAGVADEIKLGLLFSYKFITSVALAIIIYVILRLFKYLIHLILKRKARKRNKLIKRPRPVSRIIGGTFSLIFNGAILVVLLSIFASPLVGGNETLKNGVVAKDIEKFDDELLGVFVDDPNLIENQMMVRFVKGDLFIKVENSQVSDYVAITSLLSEGKVIPENLNDPQLIVDTIRHLLSFTADNTLNDKDEVIYLNEAVNLTKDLVTKAINEVKALHGDSEDLLVADGTLAVSNLLNRFKLDKVNETFKSIFELK